jgi:hypothetical protein
VSYFLFEQKAAVMHFICEKERDKVIKLARRPSLGFPLIVKKKQQIEQNR